MKGDLRKELGEHASRRRRIISPPLKSEPSPVRATYKEGAEKAHSVSPFSRCLPSMLFPLLLALLLKVFANSTV